MSIIDEEERRTRHKKHDNTMAQAMRERVKSGTKYLKTQWIPVGQTLYAIWRDKSYEYWGYEKFEQYAQKDLGITKALAMKIVKSYRFLEDNEPEVIKSGLQDREAGEVPDLDAISALRGARGKDGISREEYAYLRRMVFEKAATAAEVRKALRQIMAEKEEPDEEEEHRARRTGALKRLRKALDVFRTEAGAIKDLPDYILKTAKELFQQLEYV